MVGRNEGVMLGRDAELDWLRSVFDANRGCLVGIVGDAGLGKSRLTNEFTAIAASRDVEVIVARCEAHTITIAFYALSRVLGAMFEVEGLSDADAREYTAAQYGGLLTPGSVRARILFEAMGIDDPDAPPVQVSVDGRRRELVEVMAQAVLARPTRTVFVLEDAHWIDAPSDNILADFAARLNVTTSVFVTTYRPEFHGALHHLSDRTITLHPLADATAVRQVGQLVGDDPSLADLAERIAVAAVGNPFFAEEIVRDLAGRGVLSGGRGRYRLSGDVDEITVPATVQAVLAARIDRLSTEAKSMLNAAAVIGSDFDIDSLVLLRPETEPVLLAELVSAELIDQTEFVPRQRYCFRHPLVRTVAYESQLSAVRAQAHSRLAAAIEARDPAAADENAALIASHLEAAGELAAAHRWHMRGAESLRPRDLAAARAQWESARRIADGLPDDHDDVTAKRIAPRTMLISTTFFVGDDTDIDERYREFRDLALKSGDLTSFAIATAGRIMSFVHNDNRVPEAAELASELDEIVGGIDCDAPTKSIILISIALARFANCDFDAALRVTDTIQALHHGEPTVESGTATALRGFINTCFGHNDQGRRHLQEASAQARTLWPVGHAAVLCYVAILAAIGMYQPDDLVHDIRDALRRAESFGDIFGIVAGQCAYGTVLLRVDEALRDDAIDVLERARAGINEHQVATFALATIGTDLAIDAARRGQRDEAIDELRALFSTYMCGGSRVFAGRPGEALIELLIESGTTGDLKEAHRIVDQWQARRPGIPALDLWWLKSQALLAMADGDAEGYAGLAKQYLVLCEKLNAHGQLAQAQRMVNEIA